MHSIYHYVGNFKRTNNQAVLSFIYQQNYFTLTISFSYNIVTLFILVQDD